MNLSRRGISYRKQASSALIIVLFAVVLATVIILAIMTGAQLERQTSFYYEERMRADALAQGGMEQAIGLLRTAMGNGGQSWLSGPGRMVTISYGANGQAYATNDLSSDAWVPANTNLAAPYTPANLNSSKLDGTYPIDGDGSSMSVRWIYVYQDGTLSLADTPTISAANPLVGRYAFWVDDSSSRINLNTAWSRGATNTSSLGDASRINLAAVTNVTANGSAATGFPADDTHNISSTNAFNSDYDLRTNEIFTYVATNRFAFTAYNHSSDGLNPFGQPKIYLTTQLANLPPGFTNVPGYTNYYFDILANDTGNQTNSANDPGVAANLSDAKLAVVVNNLHSYLTNANWPEYPGTSFAGKFWGSNTDPRSFQLAVNIIEYVRAKESQQKIVSAIRGDITSGAFISHTQTPSDTQAIFANVPMPIIGFTRTPYITEMGVYWLPGVTAPPYVVLQSEIYLPPNIGIDSLNGSEFSWGHTYDYTNKFNLVASSDRWMGLSYVSGGPYANPPSNHNFYLAQGSFPLTPTNPYVEVFTCKNEEGSSGTTNSGFGLTNTAFPVTTFYYGAAIAPSNYPAYVSSCASSDPWNPSPLSASKGIGPFTIGPSNTNSLSYSYQIDDPLTGVVAANWKSNAPTWAAANTAVQTLGQARGTFPASPPPQDTTAAGGNGNVTSVGWRMPYPYLYGQTNSSGVVTNVPNPTGRMDSLSELGYVNTGAVCWTNSSGGVGANGVSWRTLRLQPEIPGAAATLPDWALLDLFALPPASSTSFAYHPYAYTSTSLTNGGAVGGRMNINGLLYPFFPSGTIPYPSSTNYFNASPDTRTAPLMALLAGATNPMTGDTNYMTTWGPTLATNILAMTLSPQGGQAFDSTNGLYAHIGELAEISQMADSGESSEGNLFEPLAQTTVSGNVFTVYTIGQALRQTPSGTIVVNGEKRYQATIERIPTVPATGTGVFRMVGVRELTP